MWPSVVSGFRAASTTEYYFISVQARHFFWAKHLKILDLAWALKEILHYGFGINPFAMVINLALADLRTMMKMLCSVNLSCTYSRRDLEYTFGCLPRKWSVNSKRWDISKWYYDGPTTLWFDWVGPSHVCCMCEILLLRSLRKTFYEDYYGSRKQGVLLLTDKRRVYWLTHCENP